MIKYNTMLSIVMIITLGVILLLAGTAYAQGSKKSNKNDEAVEVSGISIIGNQELPKTLFIVPWKNSDVGLETGLTNTLDEGMKAVDKEVFLRELDYYNFSHDEQPK